MSKIVVTIGRQYGSGGRELGQRLAKEMDFKFYDEELVDMAAKKHDMSSEVLHNVDEKATNSFLYSLVSGSMGGSTPPFYYDMPLNDKLFIAQSEIIKSVSRESSCVIVGRCADYVLQDTEVNCANLFVYAPMKSRIERISRIYELTPEKAKDKIIKTEKKRRTYYNYYSNQEWGKMTNYHLCIDPSSIGMEKAVAVVKDYILAKMGE